MQQHDSIRALVSEYGATAVRLWILTIANPGVLYATNPSTISAFFDELKTNWSTCSKLVSDWHSHPQRIAPYERLRGVSTRVAAPNACV